MLNDIIFIFFCRFFLEWMEFFKLEGSSIDVFIWNILNSLRF